MSLEELLIHSATVKRPVATVTGRYKVTFTTIATGVPCRLTPIDGRLVNTALGRMDKATHIVYLRGGQEIGQNYILEISGFSGKEFRVVEDLRAYAVTPTAPHHIECLVEEKMDTE